MAGPVRFDGRVAVVTGAGGGLGREYARLLAARGARVVVNDLGGDPLGARASRAPAEAVAEEIRKAGGLALADFSDVASPEGGRELIARALGLKEHFPPERVAPLAAWLVHEDVPCSGEIVSVGGGRFARVFFGVTRGVTGALTPEAVRDGFARALDPSDLVIPSNTSEELALFPPEGERFAPGLER